MVNRRRHSHAGTAARVKASAAIFVFVAAQFGTLFHLAEVRHARCAEHGELIDIRASLATPTATLPIAWNDRNDEASLSSATFDEGHRHEHCAMAPQRRENHAVFVPARVAVALPKLIVQDPSPHRERSGSTIALVLIAPKNSPPA